MFDYQFLRALIIAAMLLLGSGAPGLCAADSLDELRQFAAQSLHEESGKLFLESRPGGLTAVSIEGKPVAFIGSTWQLAHTAGYSGRPIDILVLVDTKAVIRGTRLVAQQEPVLTLGIEPAQIEAFVSNFAGYDLAEFPQPATGAGQEIIAGATISSSVIRSGIIRTARTIAASQGLLAGEAGGAIAMTPARIMSWDELLAIGAVKQLRVTGAEADTALGVASGAGPEASFIELALASLDSPSIGASLLGETVYSDLLAHLGPKDHAVLVAGNGLYSFKGTSWRTSGSFERIEIAQAEKTITLTKDMHRPLEKSNASGAPEFREIAIFVLPQASNFDPARPFRLSLLATREDAPGNPKSARFELPYAVPDEFLSKPQTPASEITLWQDNWKERLPSIAIVVAMLLALYLILIFQNQIAARPKLYRTIRLSYLLATVIILGAVLSAQLSVVHALAFLQALRQDFSWETFLLDPITFIIWSWVAVALLFWGRVYCGWLCPFGALQELLNKAARRLGVPQFTVPFMLHERLWPIKYIAFLGLFAVSFASLTMAFKGAEIEPFKTAVTLRFMREWPFILYALSLLAAGLFVERFFCRYLCPLGAAIAIPARVRMFEWLKRRPQCGRECRICAVHCPVQAIHPEGHINPNECIYCLNCQTLYYDEHICPPLKLRAARRAAYASPINPEAPQP